MQHYLLQLKTPSSGTFTMLLKYSEAGELIYAELRDFDLRLSELQRNWLWQYIPKCTAELEMRGKDVKCTVTPVETDLSFDAFWNLYDHKLGNKDRARKHWDALDDATRAKAMKKVKEYKFYMAHQTHGVVFAERWLSQKRYENEYTLRQ